MILIRFYSFLVFHLLVCSWCTAQNIVVKEITDDTTENVRLISDSRIALLSSTLENNKPNVQSSATATKSVNGTIHSARGYRVLIYSGIDRAKANATKADFMRRFHGTRVYMTYALPQYKIKVGDFKSRQEANELYRQMTSLYSPCMVVPDIVEINTFRKND